MKTQSMAVLMLVGLLATSYVALALSPPGPEGKKGSGTVKCTRAHTHTPKREAKKEDTMLLFISSSLLTDVKNSTFTLSIGNLQHH